MGLGIEIYCKVCDEQIVLGDGAEEDLQLCGSCIRRAMRISDTLRNMGSTDEFKKLVVEHEGDYDDDIISSGVMLARVLRQ